MNKKGSFFSNIGETLSRASTRRFTYKYSSGGKLNTESVETKFRNQSDCQLDEAEQQRIMIGNLVKTGKLSVEEAMEFAEVTGLTGTNKEEENMTYNFGVYKHTKDRSRTERYILQFDFDEQALSTIQKGKFGKKIPFHDIRDYDSEDGVRFILYLDDAEIEYDADSGEEKNKICSLLDGIVEDNKNSGLNSLPRRAASVSTKQVLKEGQIEKRGHSVSFLTWSRRYLRISEGELAYYRIGEENMTALNIIKLGPGHSFIKTHEHNCFIVSTQKKEYSFRIANPSNSKDISKIKQERDEWFAALSEAVQPSTPRSLESPVAKSPVEKQDLLNKAFEQEEYLRTTVESLQKELEQLMSIITIVEAPIQATVQMRKVQEIVKTLNVQIKTGLLAWTMKTVVAMNFAPSASPFNKDANKQDGVVGGVHSVPEKAGVNQNEDFGKYPGWNNTATSQPININVLPNNLPTQDQMSTFMSTPPSAFPFPQNIPPGSPVAPSPSPPLPSSPTIGIKEASPTTPTSPPATPEVGVSPPRVGVPPPRVGVPPPGVGVPPPGVGVPPPPPPPGGGGGIPAPPPFGSTFNLPVKPLVTPNFKVRPFFWVKVSNSMIPSSMWGKAKDRLDEIDLKMIDEMFQIEEKKTATDLSQLTKKNTPKSLLDNKRAQNLGIFLSGFKLNAQDVDRRLNFIDENDGGLPLEIVIALKRFQPSTEEAEMYKNYKGVKEELPKTDQFMIKLCEIPGLNARLDLLLFILEFPLQYEELSPAVSTVVESCNEIINSDKFHTVMEYILAIGNYLNGGTSRGGAHGFKISSLPKMVDTRGRERNYTLINLLVDMLSEKEVSALSLPVELKSVKNAVEASVKGLTAEVEVLWKGLSKIKKLNTELQMNKKTPQDSDGKFHEDINKFVSEYEFKLVDLNSRCEKMKENFNKLLTLIGEPPGKNSEDVFGNINKFLTSFTAVVDEQTKKNEIKNVRQKNPGNNNQTPAKEGQKSIRFHNKEHTNMRNIVGELKEKQAIPKMDRVKSIKQEPKQQSIKPQKRPTRRGVLQKLSGGKHKQPKWDVRYFELDDSGHLHYFKTAEGKVINSVYLRGAPVNIDQEDQCVVKIETEDRAYYLKASSSSEAIEWKNDLACYS